MVAFLDSVEAIWYQLMNAGPFHIVYLCFGFVIALTLFVHLIFWHWFDFIAIWTSFDFEDLIEIIGIWNNEQAYETFVVFK